MSNARPECVVLAEQRLAWADKRQAEFLAEAKHYLAQDPYEIVIEKGTKKDGRTKLCYRLYCRKPAPTSLRLIVGDTVHNLRSVLDSLCWHIGKRCGVGKNFAPLFANSQTDFNNKAGKAQYDLSRLPPPVLAWLNAEQPYNRWDRQPSALGTLNRLWNQDKHRASVLVGTGMVHLSVGNSFVDELRTGDGPPCKDGQCIVYVVLPMGVSTPPQLKVDIDVGIAGACHSASQYLAALSQHLRTDVIPLFECHL